MVLSAAGVREVVESVAAAGLVVGVVLLLVVVEEMEGLQGRTKASSQCEHQSDPQHPVSSVETTQ